MRAHSWHALGWLIWAIASAVFFAVWEYEGLVNRADDKQPLTFYIRKMVATPNTPLWWTLAPILIWMFVHFLIIPPRAGSCSSSRRESPSLRQRGPTAS